MRGTSGPLLEVEDLHCSFLTPRREVRAVDGVTFALDPGESLGVVGESGSGKTVTALSMLRLFGPASKVRLSGRATFEGVDLLRASPSHLRKVRGGRIGVVFQDPLTSLDPVVPVGEQIAEAIRLHKDVTRKEARRKAIDLLERVGIPDPGGRADDLPHRFSGGMRQRIMIAMAISCDPQLLIADEATTALDATVQAQILALLLELRRDMGMAMLVISHDLGVVAALCDTVQVMYAGRLAERAPTKPLLETPAHPYSEALVRLVPKLDDRTHHRLRPIPGQPPVWVSAAPGCRFAPRCERSIDRCDDHTPPLTEIAPGHTAWCWKAETPVLSTPMDLSSTRGWTERDEQEVHP